MANSEYTFTRPAAVRRMERILELLKAAPEGLTRLDLAKATALQPRGMKSYLAALRGELDGQERRIRVKAWRRQLGKGGHYIAVFEIGKEPDARKPDPEPQAKTTKRYRTRLKRERPDVYEDQLAAMRRRRAAARPAQRDRTVAALFGSPESQPRKGCNP